MARSPQIDRRLSRALSFLRCLALSEREKVPGTLCSLLLQLARWLWCGSPRPALRPVRIISDIPLECLPPAARAAAWRSWR